MKINNHAFIITLCVGQTLITRLMPWEIKCVKNVHQTLTAKSVSMTPAWNVIMDSISTRTKSAKLVRWQLLGVPHVLRMVKFVMLVIQSNSKKILLIMYVCVLKVQFGTWPWKNVSNVQVKLKIVHNVSSFKILLTSVQNAEMDWTESQAMMVKVVYATHFTLRTQQDNANFVILSKNVRHALHRIIVNYVINLKNGLLMVKENVNACKIMYKLTINVYFVVYWVVKLVRLKIHVRLVRMDSNLIKINNVFVMRTGFWMKPKSNANFVLNTWQVVINVPAEPNVMFATLSNTVNLLPLLKENVYANPNIQKIQRKNVFSALLLDV